jgi:hypothetical protein
MTGRLNAARGALHAALLGAAALSVALPAAAGPAERLREGLFRHRGSENVGLPLARYVTEDGRVFTLDRTQSTPLLKFEDSPEVWALEPSPAPRGDIIYKNDLGEPVLRATRLGGFTLFTEDRPKGEAVSVAGGAAALRLAPLSPQAVFQKLAQASIRAGRAAHHPMLFEAEATPASSALIADAAVVTSLAILRIAEGDGGQDLLARFRKVRFEEGRKPSAALKGGVLRVTVTPSEGLAGRPSSERIIRAAQGR